MYLSTTRQRRSDSSSRRRSRRLPRCATRASAHNCNADPHCNPTRPDLVIRVQRCTERKSRVDRRSTALRQPFQPARNASRLSALGFSCRHTPVSASSHPPETAPESPWHRTGEGARPQLRLVAENRPRHREDNPRMQGLPTSAKTAVQRASSSLGMARSSLATSAHRLRRTFPRIDVSSASRRPLKMARSRSCPHAHGPFSQLTCRPFPPNPGWQKKRREPFKCIGFQWRCSVLLGLFCSSRARISSDGFFDTWSS